MNEKQKAVGIGLIAVMVVLADEIIKYLALERLPLAGSLEGWRFFALAIHKNFGLAFDIPVRIPIIVGVSILIGIYLMKIIFDTWKQQSITALMAALIIIGALGNLFDRLAYGFTVDYLLITNRLAINLSDLVILCGVIGLLFATSRRKQLDKKL